MMNISNPIRKKALVESPPGAAVNRSEGRQEWTCTGRRRGLFVALLLAGLFGLGEGTFAQKGAMALKVSLFNEGTAIPFTKFLTVPLHKGILVGGERTIRYGRHSTLYHTLNMGYFYHRHLTQGVFINSGFGWDWRTSFGVKAKAQFSLGYLRNLPVQPTYVLDEGLYQVKKTSGTGHLTAAFAFGAGYLIKPRQAFSPELFVLYEPWVEFPYSPGFIPVMSHVNVQIGFKTFLKKHE